MAKVRLVQGGNPHQLYLALMASLKDPDVESVVVHKPGARVHVDGVEWMVNADGQWFRPNVEPAEAPAHV